MTKVADPAARHAVVTGTSSGIGEAIAEGLLATGWMVTGLDRSPPSIVDARFRGIEADLAQSGLIASVVDGIAHPTALVHAAGFMRVARLGQLDADSGAAMWRLHVDAAAALANALAPRLPDGGRIVLIGSRTANGAAGRSQYAATKAALVGMARSWAIEFAPRQITVNVVAPAATDTPFLRDPGRVGTAPVLPPMGRFVEAKEVAALTAFLLSPEAGAITGQQIVICAGASL
jgi:NAD(P)-dependent dehydrogenase (short-subunit alcohol dehydrogenase family)